MAFTRVAHLGLTCTDPVVTEGFYTRHFGFVRDRVLRVGEKQIVLLRLGDFQLELFRAESIAPQTPAQMDGPPHAGFRHLAFRVHDLENALREIEASAEITLGPLDLSAHGLSARIVWLRDPDGRIIEMYE